MSGQREQTDTRPREKRSAAARPAYPHLFFLLDGELPLRASARYRLDVESVRIGRNSTAIATTRERVLTIGIDDRLASQTHAQLQQVLGSWVLEDLGSKNGTFLNGAAVTRAELHDGDVLELGNSFFLFRAARPQDSLPLGDEPGSSDALSTLHGALASEFQRVRSIATSDVSLVIHGESGTGKEIVAQAVHALSGRDGPFQAINCAALPAALIESELFGHRKGAFSGATEDRTGLIAVADHGTLFLDEIGDLPTSAQVALLRVLQEGVVHPLGAPRPVRIDVRIIAATHHDLAALVGLGKFREDLLARLSGYLLELPPLRDRREDLGILIAALLRRRFGATAGRVRLSPEACRALLCHSWPMNIRELEKALQVATVLAQEGPVQLQHLPPNLRQPGNISPPDARHREELIALLKVHRGSVTAVAQSMGKARMQIHRWLKRYGIDAASYRH